MNATAIVKQVLLNPKQTPVNAANEAAILMLIITFDILMSSKKAGALPTDNPDEIMRKIKQNLSSVEKTMRKVAKEANIDFDSLIEEEQETESDSAPDTSTPEGILQLCTVDGNIVKLPNIKLDRKLYMEVARKLELIGGKWKGGKVMGFVFQADPTDMLAQIAKGERRNLKKEFQFFGTPMSVARRMVQLANIKKTDKVAEPSAGQGAIVKAIAEVQPSLMVDCYELMDVNQSFLRKIPTANLLGADFLQSNTKVKYNKIIANPPFSKNQDIDHIYAMYQRLENKGTLVTICSPHYMNCNNKKETAFRNWLAQVNASVEELAEGTFAESGTNIKTNLLIITK